MGKPRTERSLGEDEARAVSGFIRTSQRKLNLVAASIRGKAAAKALAQLTFEKRRGPNVVKKVLEAATANAEKTHQLVRDRLFVKEAFVGQTLVMKRFCTRRSEEPTSDLRP